MVLRSKQMKYCNICTAIIAPCDISLDVQFCALCREQLRHLLYRKPQDVKNKNEKLGYFTNYLSNAVIEDLPSSNSTKGPRPAPVLM